MIVILVLYWGVIPFLLIYYIRQVLRETMRDPSRCFEYKTPQGLISEKGLYLRIAACLLFTVFFESTGVIRGLFVFFFLRPSIKNFLLLGPVTAVAVVTYLVITFSILGVIYNPSLMVFIDKKEIFICKRYGSRALYRHIPIYQIKDVRYVIHSNKELSFLAGKNYYKGGEFGDGSSYQNIENSYDNRETRGADLELYDGRHFFICFNGVEKFVEVLKARMSRVGS